MYHRWDCVQMLSVHITWHLTRCYDFIHGLSSMMGHIANDCENHKPRQETSGTIDQWYHNGVSEIITDFQTKEQKLQLPKGEEHLHYSMVCAWQENASLNKLDSCVKYLDKGWNRTNVRFEYTHIWKGTYLYMNTWMYFGIFIPLYIVIKFVEAGHRYQSAPGGSQWVEDLQTSLAPDLKRYKA